MQVQNTVVDSKNFGNFDVMIRMDDGWIFSWSGSIHMFSYKADLQKALTDIVNQVVAAYAPKVA